MCKDKETPSEIGYDELDTLLREGIEHVIVCTSYVQAKYDVKNMSFDEYKDKIYDLLTRLESHKD